MLQRQVVEQSDPVEYWSELNCVLMVLKQCFDGRTMEGLWQVFDPLEDMVSFMFLHLGQLPDDLRFEALALGKLMETVSSNSISVAGMLDTAKKVHAAFVKTVSFEAGRSWSDFVKQRSANGGGVLFKYVAKMDKQFLNVSWSLTKGDNTSPANLLKDQCKK